MVLTEREPLRSTARDSGHSARPWAALVVVLTAVFMQLLDTTIVTVAVPSIQGDLSASFGTLQLVLAGYSLAFACTLITGGRLGDLYGRRRLFVIGMTGFVLASALCGAAPSALALVIARLVQGVFSGLMFPQVLAIIQVLFDGEQRNKALAAYGASIGLATISGPVLGGALIAADVFGLDWRSIFYINVPIGLLALALAPRVVPETGGHRSARLDVVGTGSVTGGLFCLVLPLVIGRDQGWPAWTWALLGGSVPLLAAFIGWELRLTRGAHGQPLVPATLFGNRSFSVGLVLCAVCFAGVPSFFFVFILSLQAGFGYSALGAGAVTLGFAVFVAIGSARSSSVVRHLGTWTLALGTGLLAIGMLGVLLTIHAMGTDPHGYLLLPALAVSGAGAGLFLAPVTGVIIAGLPRDDAGSASGVLATAQQVGAAFGIAIVGVLFFAFLGNNAAPAEQQVLPRLRQTLATAAMPPEVRAAVVTGFRDCFSDRAHAADPSQTPASCRALASQSQRAPANVHGAVRRAVLLEAVPTARRYDFSESLQQALGWQLGVFVVSMLLVLALPKVRADDVAATSPV